MSQVIKGDFVAEPASGIGNGTVEITVPQNESGLQKIQSFVIKGTKGEQIIIICKQKQNGVIEKYKYIFQYIDRGGNYTDGQGNVILEGRVKVFDYDNNTPITTNPMYSPTIKIGYVYNNVETFSIEQQMTGYEQNFNLLIPEDKYEQSAPVIYFAPHDEEIYGVGYNYFVDSETVVSL